MAGKGLKELKKRVKAPKPLRVLINGAATAAWYDLRDEDIKSQVIERLLAVCAGWRHMKGVRFIASFDDDLFMVGDPRGFQKWSIYMLFDVDKPDSVVAMVDDFRQGELTLHTYFTVQATLGRVFWPIEEIHG